MVNSRGLGADRGSYKASRTTTSEPVPGYISKKSVCSRRIGIESGRRKSVWSILSAQSALRWPQHNGCILVRWVQYNPHPVRPVHLDGPFHTLISGRNPRKVTHRALHWGTLPAPNGLYLQRTTLSPGKGCSDERGSKHRMTNHLLSR